MKSEMADAAGSARKKRFISQPISMLETSAGGDPMRFRFRREEHRVIEILDQWQDYGHSPTEVKRTWRNRRHRNYYELRTDRDLHALIYFDRGVKPESPRKWVILEEYF